MAKRNKKAATSGGKESTGMQLPKGYESIGGFGKSWPNDDTSEGDMIEGTIIEFDSFTVGTGKNKRDAQTLKLETKNGVYTVWESVGTQELFEYEEGTQAAIIFDGYGKAKPGQNAPKLFRVGVK